LKVAIITLGIYPLSTGGVQLHSYYHAKHLSEERHEATVITKPAKPVLGVETRIPGVHIDLLGSSAPIVGQLSFVLLALRKLFEIRPDIVHVHYATYFPAPAYLFSLLTGTPYVISCHGGDIFNPRRRSPVKAIQKVFFAKAAKVTTVSSELKFMLLTDYGLPERKVEVVSNGVEMSEMDTLRHSENKKSNEVPKRIAYLANLRPVKDPLLALSAFKILRQRRKDVQLVIIGGGELAGEILRQVRSEQILEESVIMKGELAHDKAMAELARCDVFLLTSRDEGGNPLSLMEAMAMERPVVAANVGGVRDVVVDRTNGLLVSVRSPESFAEAMNELLRDDEFARAVGVRASATAERYSWKQTVDRYVVTYLKATGARGDRVARKAEA
jgi:glycosyltransferase involved in cell wall biosynthesis